VWFDGRRSTFDERGGGSDPSFSEMPDGLAPPGPGSCEESLMPTTGRTQTPRVRLGWKPAASGSDPSGRLSAQLPVDDSKRMRLHRIACFVASRLKARSRDKRLAGPFVQWAVTAAKSNRAGDDPSVSADSKCHSDFPRPTRVEHLLREDRQQCRPTPLQCRRRGRRHGR
jgi:hypothetical protein